jgi:uncharacterized membrane protein YeaQ/YmgE (transglycosylase-associated protein family)
MVPPLVSFIYCVLSFILGAKNAEVSKGDSASLVVCTLMLGICGFFISVFTVSFFPGKEPGWMIWLLYIATAFVAAVAHFFGFFLCCVLRAAGNDVSV